MEVPQVRPQGQDISSEEWREYDFGPRPMPYRIDKPKELFLGSTTHRVVDIKGVTHCVPAPGHFGCVVRWQANPPVSF